MAKVLDDILNKPMDRRQFLQHVGVAATALVGLGTMLSLVRGSKVLESKPRHGFGNGKFGI